MFHINDEARWLYVDEIDEDEDPFFPSVPPNHYFGSFANGSDVEKTECKIIWTIDNFRDQVSSGRSIRMPEVGIHEDIVSLKFCLQPNVKIDSDDYIKIDCLTNHPLFPSEEISLFKVCLLTRNKEERLEVTVDEEDAVFRSGKHFKQNDILRELNNPYIDDDGKLRFLITVTTGIGIISETKKSEKYKRQMSNLQLFSEMLFNKKEFSDVVFRVEGRDIYAQKVVLIRTSPVFAAMFSGDTLENQTNTVDIVDSTYDGMYLLLEYIYKASTDKFHDLNYETCLDVLINAEKYNIDCLKKNLEEIVSDKLKIDNVLECLVTADSIDASHLKQQAMRHIVHHNKDILKLSEYSQFLTAYPDLNSEIVTALALENENP